MHVLITTRHLDITPQVKAYAEEKANRLVKYYDLIQEIEVVIEPNSPSGFHVEMIVDAEHRDNFVANSRCDSVEHCVDDCFHKLERQLTEHNKKHRNRKHPEAGTEASIRHSAV